MRRNPYARKFFLFLFVLTEIAVEFVDLHGSVNAASCVQSCVQYDVVHRGVLPVAVTAYFPFVSSVLAEYMALSISIALLRIRWTDRLLLSLNKRRNFIVLATISIIIPVVSFRWIILSELGLLTLIAASFYPFFEGKFPPKGRMRLPYFIGMKKVA